MIPPELVTLRDFLRWAVSRFNEVGLHFGHGTQNAYDEAAYLLLHALHLPLDRMEPFLNAALTESERKTVFALLNRRIDERIPAAYLTHEAWLGDFPFYVDERVIVPRSHIAELLLDDPLAPWVSDPDAVVSALDLCTGSGCLAILLAHAFPNARIDAADISTDALEVAARNVAEYQLGNRIGLIHSDLFAGLQGRSYDIIISNPPYVTGASMRVLPAEYRHEPALALASGEDGLDAVRDIIALSRAHLKPNGILAVEVGGNRAIVETAFPRLGFTWLESKNGEGMVFLLTREQLPE
ncbi:MAG: 50S ribosomal protein L3 N(5)-glutamine methyltransferase [Rhodocyclaceae bacterium]|jgi:ribosomal protein L3 glutamine methyltransferase|nr:50S ribosomal protein L3 N(5)-glutamine methyltransferase [Rhodocyclaceae bacterium]MCZ7655626.1 50S ribosomal protein L3 N(5)-glutamine methyltransferase [Rhodocyclaceae bacterium]